MKIDLKKHWRKKIHELKPTKNNIEMVDFLAWRISYVSKALAPKLCKAPDDQHRIQGL